MNYPLLSRYLGLFFAVVGLSMLPAAAWSLYYGEFRVLSGFFASMAICGVIGGSLFRLGKNAKGRMYSREALALVGIGWLVTAALGSLPYLFGGMFSNPVDAYFETMSGFTTTGASVLVDIESSSRGLLFWRSFTHWLGGMGIIVLFLSLLPYIGAGGKQLFKNESPGPDPRGLMPRIRDTAAMLWKIYVGLTMLQVLILLGMGLTFFDSLCHTFGTVATGGFSPYNASVGHFSGFGVELTILIFMILAGTNFGLFYSMIGRDFAAPFRDREWRVYILVLVLATLAVTADLWFEGVVTSAGGALRQASFTVTSIMTTTGYVTADFDLWPAFSRMLLLLLMFVGASAGSTGGGLKVIRIIILWKIAWARIHKAYAPHSVKTLRIGSDVISPEVQHTTLVFFLLFLFLFVLGTLIMTLMGLEPISALSSVAATLNNIGPGLNQVGPTVNYAEIPALGKGILSLFMVMGRIELFAILVLFSPAFWRRN